MDLLINGIEMPKSCEDCFACYDCSYEGFDYCCILKTSTIRGKRRKDCPIVEVEGRTVDNHIDAQELAFGLFANNRDVQVLYKLLNEAPTVIEASKER